MSGRSMDRIRLWRWLSEAVGVALFTGVKIEFLVIQ
jgi:hypothetical protein